MELKELMIIGDKTFTRRLKNPCNGIESHEFFP
jgi:hypothetical protein